MSQIDDSDRAEIEAYDPKAVEPKWQQAWDEEGLYNSDIDPDRKKFYAAQQRDATRDSGCGWHAA